MTPSTGHTAPATAPGRREPTLGFTLVEVVITLAVIGVGLVPAAALLLNASHQREESGLRMQVLNAAQGLLEEILGVEPAGVPGSYDGITRAVAGVEGAEAVGDVLVVAVDASDPALIQVSVTGNWQVRGRAETLTLITEIYDIHAPR